MNDVNGRICALIWRMIKLFSEYSELFCSLSKKKQTVFKILTV